MAIAVLLIAPWTIAHAANSRPLPSSDSWVRIAAGETHGYSVPAFPGGTHVRVDQLDIDVVLTASTPSGPPVQVNAPGGPRGREDLVIESGAAFELAIAPKLRNIPGGRYRVHVAPLHKSDAPAEVLRGLAASGALEIAQSAEGQRQSREHLRRALAATPDSDVPLRALVTFRIGVMSRRLGELEDSEESYRRALELQLDLEDRGGEARTRNGLGQVLLDRGSIDEARVEFEQAVAAAEASGEAYEGASASNNICLTELYRGHVELARPCLEHAVERYREARLGEHTSVPLVNLAAALEFLGFPDLSRQRYEEALALRRGGVEKLPIAYVLLNLAYLERNVGDFGSAMVRVDEAFAIAKELGDRKMQARALRNKGGILDAAGLPRRAEIYWRESLALALSLDDQQVQADTLSALADVLEDPVEADRMHRDALARYEAKKDSRSAAREHVSLAGLARGRGNLDAASAHLKVAQERAGQSGVRAVRLAATLESARLALARGDGKALDAAIATGTELLGDYSTPLERLSLGAVEIESLMLAGRRPAAMERAESLLRAGSPGHGFTQSPEMRERERAARAEVLALWVEAFSRGAAGLDEGAIGKGLRLLDSVRSTEMSAWTAYARAPAGEAQRALQRELSHRRALLEAAEREGAKPERIAALRKMVEETTLALDATERKPVAHVATEAVDLEGMQARLQPGGLLLIYATGSPSLLRIAVSPTQAAIRIVGTRTAAESAVADLAQALRGSGAKTVAGTSAHAGKLLLDGIDLTDVRRVHVVLDGNLQDLAFAALSDPATGRPLVERAAVSHLPVIGWLHDDPVQLGAARIAVFANAVFDTEGATAQVDNPMRGDPRFPRLPMTAVEAAFISSRAGAARVDEWIGARATRDALLAAISSSYGIVHIATHAEADPERLDATALFLSGDRSKPTSGFVSVQDLLAHPSHATLVVLSGCETSAGRRIALGGDFGLTEALLAAGVRHVVSARWPVEDRGASEVMRAFYDRLLGDSPSPADALAAARGDLEARGSRAGLRAWAAFRVTSSMQSSSSTQSPER